MTDSAQPRLLVTLCTYNERENLELLIPEIHKYLPSAAILVIDDNSPDGTGEYAKELKKTDSRIHSIHRSGKLGLGTATIAGFQYAIENHYDLVLNLDADFSHPPRFMPDLVEATKTADVAIGSRYIPGGKIEGWGPKRYFMSGAVTGICLNSSFHVCCKIGIFLQETRVKIRIHSQHIWCDQNLPVAA